MKSLVPLVSLIFLSFCTKAQIYQYIPMDLDTSSYWIQEYNYYQGLPYVSIKGEVLQYVEKDTTIGLHKYHKINGYCTERATGQAPSNSLAWYSNFVNCYSTNLFIREDTLTKKIFELRSFNPLEEIVLLDFNLTLGDSMSHVPPDSLAFLLPIDSILIQNYFSVNRRSFYTTTFTSLVYSRIEGVGATFNFPAVGNGEWGLPNYTLNAYSKNNTLLYKRDSYPIDSCYRKTSRNGACWPLSIRQEDVSNFSIVMSNNRLFITGVKEKLHIRLLNLNGQLILKDTALKNYEKDLGSSPPGIYILSLQSSMGITNKKIFIH